MHVLSYIDIEDNVDAQSKYWIARVKFYELLAPKQGAGYLVLPLQQMLKLSRFVVSKCYLRLIQILVHAKVCCVFLLIFGGVIVFDKSLFVV